jgi:hypothetical protein
VVIDDPSEERGQPIRPIIAMLGYASAGVSESAEPRSAANAACGQGPALGRADWSRPDASSAGAAGVQDDHPGRKMIKMIMVLRVITLLKR